MFSTIKNGITQYSFTSFNSREVGHAFFARSGGISPHPWDSLNQGGTVGDERKNVIENRKRAFLSIDRPVESIFDVWQVHSADVICTESPRPLEADHTKGDAILTNNPGVTLFMRFADCVPIMVYEPKKHVVGIIHAGWQGTVKKVVSATIKKMIEKYNCEPQNIIAGIGPSIGVCHYQVGEEVIIEVDKTFGSLSEKIIEIRDSKTYLNLWKANEILLKESGIANIEIAGMCTACNKDIWFSHRGESGKTGRFGAALFLKKAIE